MATLDGGGTPAHEIRDPIAESDPEVDVLQEELDRDPIDDGGSQSSNGSSGADEIDPIPDTSVCPWRTAQHYDEECSRYHDCPGHVLERHRDEQSHEIGHDADESPEAEEEDHEDPSAEDDDNGQPDASADMPALGTQLSAIDLEASPIASREALSRVSTPAEARDPEPETHVNDDVPPAPEAHNTTETAQTPTPEEPSGPSSSTQARGARSRPVEIVLPRWQPDSEVTYCPICNTQFSIFVRKHHCRKCGRVVCNSCSPHRITIPYQYIVQPPGYSSIPQRYPPLPGNEGYVDFNSLGGGERVRLCNPCVPDPNTAPPQTQEPSPRGHQRSASNLLSPGAYPGGSSGRYGPHGAAPVGDPFARNRSVTMQSVASSSSQSSRGQYRGPPIFGGTPPAYFPSGSSSQQRQSYAPVPASRYYDGRGRAGPSNVGSSSMMDRSLPPLPQAQPQLAEEDECPVCHRELPRRTLPNFEALREAHINICITTHSAYGSPRSAAAGNGDGADGAPLPPIPPRTTRMFPYVATEKDCVDSAECSICLEEFEVGVAMARLECLCRFHRHCIRAWWERHPGRCPMHQHDGYGF